MISFLFLFRIGINYITIDDELTAMTRAANKSMMVKSGNEALQVASIFTLNTRLTCQLLSQSFRVHTDVSRALQDSNFCLQCIVREWHDIPIEDGLNCCYQ